MKRNDLMVALIVVLTMFNVLSLGYELGTRHGFSDANRQWQNALDIASLEYLKPDDEREQRDDR